MQPDNQEIIDKLRHKEKTALKGMLIALGAAAVGTITAIGAEMYVAAKYVKSGWFKEFWKSRVRFKSPAWIGSTLENPVWQIGVGVGLAGVIFGLLKSNKAETLAEVRDSMTPCGIPVGGADKQWASDALRKDPKSEEPQVRAK